MTNVHRTDNLIRILGKIKDLRRRGWIKRDVSTPESDADHMYSVALEVLLMTPPHLNKCHCLELALIHDLPEVYSSDYTPGEISKDEKSALEHAAAQKLSAELNFPLLLDWFKEYEAQTTPEAKFVRCLDKMDNIVTTAYYEGEGRTDWPVVSEFSLQALDNLSTIECADKSACIQTIQHIMQTSEKGGKHE